MTGVVTWLKHMARGIAVWLPVIVVIGFVMPWPPARRGTSQHPGQVMITVAAFWHSKSWHSARTHGWVKETSQTRAYILLPSVFTRPGIVSVSQVNGDPPVVTEATAPFWVLAVPGAIALCVLGLGPFRRGSDRRRRSIEPWVAPGPADPSRVERSSEAEDAERDRARHRKHPKRSGRFGYDRRVAVYLRHADDPGRGNTDGSRM